LRTIKEKEFAHCDVDDIQFVKIIALTRILFPRVGINLSTREDAKLRDNLLEIGITRMSAGSNTSVGGYALLDEEQQDPQFDIKDDRSIADVIALLKQKNFDPVFTDWRRIENTI
jgi:2-iminoacetate synthase